MNSPVENFEKDLVLRENVKGTELSTNYVDKTMKFLADTLAKTLGPFGSNTIIQDKMLQHKVTKDGYTVLKSINFDLDIPRIILEMIKSVSRNQVRMVGDGTTSSVIVSNALYQNLMEIKNKFNFPPKLLSDVVNLCYEIMTSEEYKTEPFNVRYYAKPISEDMHELKDIAKVSCNNDANNGELIYDLFQEIGRYGIVNLEKSKSEETHYEITRGIELPRGFTNLLMATDKNKMEAEYLNPLVMIVDEKITQEDLPFMCNLLGEICGSLKQSLVIVARGFDAYFDTFIQANLVNNNGLPIICVPMAMATKDDHDRVDDLATFLGCEVFRKSEGYTLGSEDVKQIMHKLGSCNKVFATETITRFIEGFGDKEAINERCNLIKEKIEDLIRSESYIEHDIDIFNLRKRLAGLQSALAVHYVGGNSESEKESDKYLLEDAVFACRSALKHGYIFGGNLIIPYILNEKENNDLVFTMIKSKLSEKIDIGDNYDKEIDAIINAVFEAFLKSYATVLNNFYNDMENAETKANVFLSEGKFYNIATLKVEDLWETSVINSVDTDIQIFKSVSSIIGLIVTSNQFITLN